MSYFLSQIVCSQPTLWCHSFRFTTVVMLTMHDMLRINDNQFDADYVYYVRNFNNYKHFNRSATVKSPECIADVFHHG
jgi:hypothetical protein